MNYEEITLNHLFRHENLQEDIISKIDFQDKITELKKLVNKKEPRLKWKIVLDEVIGVSTKLLNISLKDILESAWKEYDEVQKYLDEDKYDTDDVFLIPLVEHSIVSEHFPKIEILIEDSCIGRIDFKIQVELVLSGVILKISEGNILGVKGGSCKSNGTFLCEGVTLFENENIVFEF